jgi:hypothetical protein
LKRDLDAKARSELFRNKFRLPSKEMLDGDVTCRLWTPYAKKYIKGKIYISKNYICFASKILRQVEVIIPIRDIYLVEKPHHNNNNISEYEFDNSLVITTKQKENFLFSNFFECDLVLRKISDMLLSNEECSVPPVDPGLNVNEKNETDKQSSEHSSLMIMFCQSAYSDEKKAQESIKEANWQKHFSDYGRGISFYRTTELYELILDGIPDKYRCELWLIFSGL